MRMILQKSRRLNSVIFFVIFQAKERERERERGGEEITWAGLRWNESQHKKNYILMEKFSLSFSFLFPPFDRRPNEDNNYQLDVRRER